MIVKFKFEVARQRHGRQVIEKVEPLKPVETAPKAVKASRAARRLALAYFIERAIDSGLMTDYADAARRLGVTRARLTQVMDSAVALVAVQEAVLVGAGAT